jgi:phosphate transport system substrate-binding protein
MKPLILFIVAAFFSVSSQALLINGAGASFPAPIYSKWFLEYQKEQPDVRINYQSIGSGAGITQVVSQTVDFGASDAPMKEEDIKKSAVPILHIPTVMGAVTISYNLPDYQGELKLTPELIVGIFMGQIKTWDDPLLLKLNPNLASVANKYILPVQRSDGSGTTSIFTEYLSKSWRRKISELAHRSRWERQRGRQWRRKTKSRGHWLCGIDLCSR